MERVHLGTGSNRLEGIYLGTSNNQLDFRRDLDRIQIYSSLCKIMLHLHLTVVFIARWIVRTVM